MKFDMILTIVNHGYADLVMDAAKSKGATGGTIINARGTAGDVEKFFNISLQPEKEMVLIVVPHEIRHDVMAEITLKAGLKTIGKGVIFSIPIDQEVGLTKE